MKKALITVTAVISFFIGGISQAAVDLNPDHPDVYVVKRGDTLWDISAMFLRDPWLWPEIWQVNPQVNNPHLIFPGDVLSLVYIDGQPRLVRGNKLPDGTIKLRPQARELSAGEAITTIPLEIIRPFLVNARVVTEEQIANAGYVLAPVGERLVVGGNDKVYARGVPEPRGTSYSVFRRGDDYVDPETEEFLGIEARHLAEASITREGDPATLFLEEANLEVLIGDLALPGNDEPLRPVYSPRAPDYEVEATLIDVYGGVTQIGQYNVVVLNRGEREGIEPGHVMTIWTKGEEIVDRVATARKKDSEGFFESIGNAGSKERVTLPDERAGSLMVFRTFDKVSLALVMSATRPIHVLDKARTP